MNWNNLFQKIGFSDKHAKILFIGSVFFGISEAICILAQMYLISLIATKIFLLHIAVTSLYMWFLLLALVMVLGVISARLSDFCANKLSFHIKKETTGLLLDKMDRLGGSYGSGIESSKALNLLTDGTQRLEDFFAQFLPQVLKCAIIPIFYLLVIVPKDWISGLILLITIPVLLIFMMLIGRFSKAASEKQWQSLQEISGYLHDAMRYLSWLKVWGKAEESVCKVEEKSELFRIKTLKVMRVAFLSAFVLELFTMIGVALVAVVLGVRLVEGMIGFQVALFIILLAPEFYAPLRLVGSKYHDSIKAMTAFREIAEFLMQKEPIRGNETLLLTKAPQVTFQHVQYFYETSQKGVQDITFTLEPASVTMIIGQSGSGKSTLLYLAAGMMLPQQGTIFYNEQNIAFATEKSLRDAVGFLGQDVYIFSDTVYGNIALGDESITKERVKEVCKIIGLDSFIESLEEKYDTYLGEKGKGLSGGQKRLLGIARIFVRERKFIICDEPFAGLDTNTESIIASALEKLAQGRTMLVVSHRDKILAPTTKKLIIKDGILEEIL